MSQQWMTKKVQDLRAGDLVSGISGNFALEVIGVETQGDKILVQHYSDLYRLHTATYEMQRNQQIPVAVSGVKHMDFITTHTLN